MGNGINNFGNVGIGTTGHWQVGCESGKWEPIRFYEGTTLAIVFQMLVVRHGI